MKVLHGLVVFFLSFNLLAETSSQPIPVTVKTFESVAVDVISDAPAQVIVNNQPDISAEIAAKVISIDVLEGDRVEAGEQLLQLDCRKRGLARDIAQAAFTQSQARLSFARSQLKRANNLKKKNSISDELLDQRSTELKEATANQLTQKHNLAEAEIDFANCRISAPFAAIVTKRLVSEGSYVVPGTPLVSLVRLNDTEIEAQLRQSQVETIRNAEIVWLESKNRRYPLKLRTILPVYDELSKTARVKLGFEKLENIWPGADARLFWTTGSEQLPAQYITRRNNELGVFIVENDKARFLRLEDAVEGRAASVNLEPMKLIVNEGRHRLNDADQVEVITTEQ